MSNFIVMMNKEEALATCAALQKAIDHAKNLDMFIKVDEDTTLLENVLKEITEAYNSSYRRYAGVRVL